MQLAGLGDGVALLAGVNDEQGAGELLHVLHAAEILLELGDLALVLDDFLLGEHGERAVLLHLAQLSQTVDTGAHGLEVRQHAAEPAGVDIILIDALRLFLDGVLRLLLRADKQDVLAVGGKITDEVVGLFDLLDGLLQIDDIDAVALRVDVRSHLGVPASGLMTKVDACFEQTLHGYDCHFCVSPFCFDLQSVPLPRPPPRRHWDGASRAVWVLNLRAFAHAVLLYRRKFQFSSVFCEKLVRFFRFLRKIPSSGGDSGSYPARTQLK